MLYRIITENKNKAAILSMVSGVFDGFTAIESTGFWRGKQENSLIIEIVCPEFNYKDLIGVCIAIKRYNCQESVLLQAIELSSEFI